jgi:hypothetical protein
MDEIRTSLRRGQKTKLLVMVILCVAAAAYGAWQYWIRLPQREMEFERYQTAAASFETLVAKSEEGPLTPEEIATYNQAAGVLDKFKDDKPQRPSKYDGIINLWLWFIGGLSGVPFLLWPFWKYRNGGWVLHVDGTLRTPKGEQIPSADMKNIDMSTWRGVIDPQASNKATWRAKLELTDGRNITLDDYPWDGIGKIIARLAHQFHPDAWDSEGEPVKEGIEKAARKLKGDADKDEEN